MKSSPATSAVQGQMEGRGGIDQERAMQIINNVAEEYIDQGDTSFATKKEFCETILWLRAHDGKRMQQLSTALHDTIIICAKGLQI